MSEFEDKPLVSAMATDLKLNESDEDQTDEEKNEEEGLGGLTTRFSNVLDAKVSEVRVSKRLTDSPVCLVIPEGGMHAHIERILRLNNQEMPSQKRIMEINPDHTLINGLKAIHAGSPDSDQVTEWIELLYDQALLAEGSPIEDPGLFAGRMTRLLERAIAN